MKIIADENIHFRFIKTLETHHYEVISIATSNASISDIEVIEATFQQSGILITEDKDFGELVFAYGLSKVTVVFLRYRLAELNKIEENLIKVIAEYAEKEEKYFIVITSVKIRIRNI